MLINKLTFIFILLFGFSSYCMGGGINRKEAKGKEKVSNTEKEAEDEIRIGGVSYNVEENLDHEQMATIHVVEILADQGGESSSDEIDLPPLHLFLRDRELLDVRLVIEELKEAKRKKKNFLKSGLILHGPAGNGKFTIAQIISKKSKWELVALEAQKLVDGEYLYDDEDQGDKQISKHLEIIIKNLDRKSKSKEDRRIKNAIKALLYAVSKRPTILFLHNVEILFAQKGLVALNMLMNSFKDFKPFALVFLIASTRSSNIITNQLTTELFHPINVKLHDWEGRSAIWKYYFKKYNLGMLLCSIDSQPEERTLHPIFLINLIGLTQNFSGSDIEEIICRTNRAINAQIPHTNEVWSISILKNSYSFEDASNALGSLMMIAIFPLSLLATSGLRYTDNGPQEYLFSCYEIQKEKLAWKQVMLLSEKISKRTKCWNSIKFVGYWGSKIAFGIGAFVFNKGSEYGSIALSGALRRAMSCGAGTIGLTAYLIKPAIEGVLEMSKDEIKRLAVEKSQTWNPPLKDDEKGKEKVGEKEQDKDN